MYDDFPHIPTKLQVLQTYVHQLEDFSSVNSIFRSGGFCMCEVVSCADSPVAQAIDPVALDFVQPLTICLSGVVDSLA